MAATNKKKPRQQQNQANQNQNKDAGNSQKTKNKKSSSGSDKKSSSSVCPWLIGIFILFGAIAGVITYDTQATGGGVFESM